jgi:diguanylate cyclase (GGDEF)-like protein/putative nucleotidyltransferase with HDIG domain
VPSTDTALADTSITDAPAASNAPSGRFHLSTQALRRAVWVVSGLVAATFVALVAMPFPDRVAYLLGQWVFVGVALLAAGGSTFAWRHSTGVERRFWFACTAAGLLIASSQVYYTTYAAFVDARGPAVPSVATALDLASVLVFIVLLGTLTRFRHTSRFSLVRYVMDEAAVSIAASVVLAAFVLRPWFDSLGILDAWPRMLSGLYPVVGAHIVIGTFRNIVGRRPSRWQRWEGFVAGGLSCLGLSLIAWPLWYVSWAVDFGGALAAVPSEALSLSGLLLIFGAAVYRHTERHAEWHLAPLPAIEPTAGWIATVVFPAIELACIPLFGVLAYQARDVEPAFRMYSVSTAVIVGVVVLRTVLTIIDNGHLLNRSVTDPLTGVYNHRHFHERLLTAVSTAERFTEEVSVAVIDVDDFNRVNTSVGHAAGDGALMAVASLIRSTVRGSDVVCRTGGDEFGIVFPATSPDVAFEVSQRVVAAVREHPGPHGRSVTVSMGVAGLPLHAADREELLRMADGAQYWAKYHGKDQAVLYDSDVVTALDAEERIRGLQDGLHLSTVRALAAAVDARSPGMEHHSRNVAALAVLLARELELDDRTATLLEVAALVHDVGKIGVSDRILHKRGPLTAEETLVVREHSALGERVLRSTKLDEVLPWVRHHHENWDGTGYPDGLRGDRIPLEARILTICDSYDALTSERSYREAMSKGAALQEIDLNLGSQYDPALGEVFLKMAAGRQVL